MAISMHWVNLGNNNTSNQVALLVALGNMLYCGKQFYVSAWKQLKNGLANMDTLVALSTLIAFLFSVFNTFWENPCGAVEELCGIHISMHQ